MQKYTMTAYEHFLKLVTMIGLVLAGLLLASLLSGLVLLANGFSFPEIMDMSQSGMANLSAGIMRALLFTQHLCMFIIPGFLFGMLVYHKDIWRELKLARSPSLALAFLGIIFLIVSYPLVNLGFLLNEVMPLPSWAQNLEQEASETLKSVLDMNSPLIFFINLILIAIIPGIGEELVFRGIVQKHVGGWLKNPVIAIWVAAFIFSAMHLQFEGFIPRFALGAILGYLYYWTNNLWVPIITHAFNNGIQVLAIYAFDMDLEAVDQPTEDLQWWLIVLSVVFMYFIYSLIIKIRS